MGAILNPHEFLPRAVGASVFMVFVRFIYTRAKYANDILQESVRAIVDSELKRSLIKRVDDKAVEFERKLKQEVQGFIVKLLHRSLEKYMKKRQNTKPISPEMISGVISGDLDQQVKTFSYISGVSEDIVLAIVGMVKVDSEIILQSAERISHKLGLDPKFMSLIIDIIVDDFDADFMGTQNLSDNLSKKISRFITV